MKFVAAAIMLTLLCGLPMPGQCDTGGCKLSVELFSDSPLLSYITGKPYSLNLRLTNPTGDEIALEELEIVGRSDNKDVAIDIKPVGDAPKSVAAGQEAVASYTLTFPETVGNKVVVFTGSAKCSIGGDVKGELQVLVTPSIELTMLPTRMILKSSKEENRVGVSVINHLDSMFSGKITLNASPGLKVSSTADNIRVDPYGLEAFLFSVKPEGALVPGHYAVYIDVAGKLKDWIAIDAPVFANKPAESIVVDGKLGDWKGAAAVAIARLIDGSKWEKIGKAHFAWDKTNLYLAIEVSDDNQCSTDTIVIGFDPNINGAKAAGGGYNDDDYEITLRGAEAGSTALLTWSAGKPQDIQTDIPFAFSREGDKSRYEIAIPWSEAKPFKPAKGAKFAMSILVNDSDGGAVTQTEWGGGLAGQVDPRKFVPVVLQ
ncbi:MAG: sugar-binding protein [Armatimonadota bacterium]|nr:hypothetical protein [bacterium]